MCVTALVLAGGAGTRLAPLKLDVPKPMLPLVGRPLLAWLVDLLLLHAEKVVICAGSKASLLMSGISCGERVFLFADNEAGTAAAVVDAAQAHPAPQFLICNADTVNDLDLLGFMHFHLHRGGHATIALTRRPEVQNAGAFAVGRNGRVLRSFEDGQIGRPPHLGAAWHGASTGVFAISQHALEAAGTAAISIERHLLPRLIPSDKGLLAFDNGQRMSLDIGTPERLKIMNEMEQRIIEVYRGRTARSRN